MDIAPIIFIAGLVSVLVVPWLLTLLLRPATKPRTLWLQLSFLYCGFLCIIGATGFGTLGLLGNIFHREIDQLLSWAAVVSGFLVPGVVMLAWAYTARVVVTDTGLEQYSPLGSRILPWSVIDAVRYRPQAGFRVFSGNRRLVTIPGAGDISYFLAECNRHNIVVSGFDMDTSDAR